jgi:hypothetical protein
MNPFNLAAAMMFSGLDRVRSRVSSIPGLRWSRRRTPRHLQLLGTGAGERKHRFEVLQGGQRASKRRLVLGVY